MTKASTAVDEDAMQDMMLGGVKPIVLPDILDLDAAAGLLAMLRAAVDAGTQIRLDASSIQSIGLSGIQVILAAAKSAPGMRIVNPSAVFSAACAGLGLDHCLPAMDTDPAAKDPTFEEGTPVEHSGAPDLQPGDDTCSLEATNAQPDAVPDAPRILTIDDSRTMRDMLKLTLSTSGFDVLQAIDGRDGIDVLQKENVDVVITDINMPRMDGYGVIKHLRDDRRYDSVPILVLTTESDSEKKERARELGATGFIVKPFNPERLVEIIRKVSA